MPEDPKFPQLPFLTREMLKFGNKATIELELTTITKESLTVLISGMTREGPFQLRANVTQTFNSETNRFRLPDIPISVTVSVAEANNLTNEVVCTLFLNINGVRNTLLCQGALAQFWGLSWPHHPQQSPLQLRGHHTTETTPNPIAGAQISDAVEVGQFWILKAINLTFVASGTAASRRLALSIAHADGGTFLIPTPADITAGQTVRICFMEGGEMFNDSVGLRQLAPLPSNLVLPPNTGIATVTTAMEADDDISAANIIFEQFQGEIP